MERFLLQEQRLLAEQVANIRTELAVHRNMTELRLNAIVSRLHSIEHLPPMALPIPKTEPAAGATNIRLQMAAIILGIVYLGGGRISEALGLIAALLSRHAT